MKGLRWRLFAAAGIVAAGCTAIAGLEDPRELREEVTDGFGGADGAEGSASDAGTNPDEDAATCIADLTSDPRNCGACGHDCAGGGCASGRCTPVAFITEANGNVVRAVTANDTHVYWANSTANVIHRIDVDGTDRQEVVASGATQLGIDATHLYFTSGDLRRMELATRAVQTIATGLSACIGFDPDGVHLYGTNAGSSTIVRLQRDGGDRRVIFGSDAGVAAPWGVTATSTHWYWSQGLHLEPDGSILRRLRPSGPTTPLHLHQANPNCLFVGDDGRLYWPNADQGTIHRSELDGSGYETLATAQTVPTQVVVTTKFLYWNSANQVMRLAR